MFLLLFFYSFFYYYQYFLLWLSLFLLSKGFINIYMCKWYLTIWSTRILVYQKEEEEKLRKEEEERLKKEEEERIKQDQEEKLKVNCL